MTEDRSSLRRRILRQAGYCTQIGSPLYGGLLERVAADVEVGGPSWAILAGREGAPGSVPSLRLMGAVHRLVLEERAPALAHCYAAARRGDPAATAAETWPTFRAVLEEHRDELRRRVEDPIQTNEVGRSSALLGGFLMVARHTGLPLRVLELGASAGLNLRFDHFAYEIDGNVVGDTGSPVRLGTPSESRPPALEGWLEVAERRGCDSRPLDPVSREGRLTLLSYVWADQAERLARLEGAMEVARRVPATIDQQAAAEWLGRRLREPCPRRATVVFHSLVLQYLDPAERQAVDDVMAEAGRAASSQAPLARLAMEPAGELADVRLTTWPGGQERLVARAGYHGMPVQWLG